MLLTCHFDDFGLLFATQAPTRPAAASALARVCPDAFDLLLDLSWWPKVEAESAQVSCCTA